MKQIICVVFLLLICSALSEGRSGSQRNYQNTRKSDYNKGYSSGSNDLYSEGETPQHVFKFGGMDRNEGGVFTGGFDGFGQESSFLNAENNGRQGRSSRQRSSNSNNYNKKNNYNSDNYHNGNYNNNDNYNSNSDNYNSNDNGYFSNNNNGNYDNDNGYSSNTDYGGSNKDSDYGFSDKSNYGGRGNYGNQNSYDGDRGYNYGNQRESYGNGGNSGDQGYDSSDYYNNRGYSNHRVAGRQGRSRGRSRGSASGGGGGNYNDETEAAQAIYHGNPNAEAQNLDGVLDGKPVYIGEYDERSPEMGKPRNNIGDYLYGEDMVFK